MRALFIATDRYDKSTETKFDFYDENFRHLDVRNGHPNATVPPAKPKTFELMRKLAERLARGIPQVRVDFYEINGRTYFGEITFFHWGGFVPFEPAEWDRRFGEMISLPHI